MITLFFKNPNKPAPKFTGFYPLSPFTPYQIAEAAKKQITPAEWVRRNDLIRDAANAVEFYSGAMVFPKSPEGFAKYGICRVIGITRHYAEVTGNEWPESDEPFVVHVHTMRTPSEAISATKGFFTKTRPEGFKDAE